MTTWAAIPLVTSIAYVVLLMLALPSIARRANRLFAVYLGAAAFWSFTSFMLHLNASPSNALLWNELLAIALVWTLIAYFHFIRGYTNQRGGLGVYIGYSLLAVFAVLSLRGYIVLKAVVVNGVLTNDLGWALYIIAVFSLGYSGAVIAQLIQKYRHSVDATDRNRTMYLIVGWVILVALTYTNMIPSVAGFPLDHIGSLINAVIITYAISRFHLLDVRFLIRRALSFAILAVGMVGVTMGSILLGQRLFPTQPTGVLTASAIVLVLILAVAARPLSRFAEEGVDRLFYRETYNYRQALLGFSTKVGNIINLNELANELLPTVTKALKVTRAELLFQQNGGNFTTQFAYPETTGDTPITLALDNPLVGVLEKQSDPVDLDQIDGVPQLMGLWEADRAALSASGLEMFLPIKSRGRLIGILALGRKRSGLFYHEDIQLVQSMASQAGIIIENARVYSQAITWANTDGLTELYNHRHFHERIDQEIARGSRFGTVFSLIMVDLDHFKTYNDNYGHLAGDEVLRKVGRCIEGSIRSVDLAFRYGGEEFTVILPATRLNDAYKAAERIRKTIEAKASTGVTPVTASLGISNWPIDGMTKEAIIGRADAALYQAKQAGRNRTCLSSEVVKAGASLISMELESKERALSIIYALAATVDAKDHYTYGHSKKVSQYAVALSEALGLPPEKVGTIRAAGLLHDIGKIAVPDSTLNKAGPLTEEEWEPLRAHPELGMEILKHVIDLVNCLPAVLHHHEHYDGSGYPHGLKGEDIPLEARIMAIADVYDAITSIRPYRNQLTPQEALDELKRCAGTQFDPGLVEAFCRAIEPLLPRQLEVK